MLLPEPLRQAISELHSGSLTDASKKLSLAYRTSPHTAFSSSSKAQLAYLLTRLPATFAVLVRVLEIFFQRERGHISSFLDLGCGPGTSLWALELLGIAPEKLFCVEKDATMIQLAKNLLHKSDFTSPITWLQKDLLEVKQSAEVVLLSYVLNEVKELEFSFLESLAQKNLILIEPGTPEGYQRLMRIRQEALKRGWGIVAPCPHSSICPLQNTSSWCHFYARVERSKEHRIAKEASLGFEDEKFSFLILEKPDLKRIKPPVILSFPKRSKGFIELNVCDPDGSSKTLKILQKNKPLFKKAKKLNWGDFLEDGPSA